MFRRTHVPRSISYVAIEMSLGEMTRHVDTVPRTSLSLAIMQLSMKKCTAKEKSYRKQLTKASKCAIPPVNKKHIGSLAICTETRIRFVEDTVIQTVSYSLYGILHVRFSSQDFL